MPDESFNPYAAPTTTATEPAEPQTGHVRMSEASLKTAIRLMVIAEVAFAAGWLILISIMFLWNSPRKFDSESVLTTG